LQKRKKYDQWGKAVMLNGNKFKPEPLIVSVLLMLIPLMEPVKQKRLPQ
jgi:hypothetical protein